MSDSTHGTLVPLLDKPQQADESGGGGLGHETPIRQVTARTEDPIPKIVTIMSNGKRGGTEVFINGIRVTQNCESVSWSHDARGVPRVKLVMVGVQIEAIGGEAQ
ncbi:MAG TPA: hypothetical protein VHO25_16640, partial [Polyangiaceae bacterium]|nr:hypothetical protein [Polyangiaceae bacterium]